MTEIEKKFIFVFKIGERTRVPLATGLPLIVAYGDRDDVDECDGEDERDG